MEKKLSLEYVKYSFSSPIPKQKVFRKILMKSYISKVIPVARQATLRTMAESLSCMF